jgi:hypothetical protein
LRRRVGRWRHRRREVGDAIPTSGDDVLNGYKEKAVIKPVGAGADGSKQLSPGARRGGIPLQTRCARVVDPLAPLTGEERGDGVEVVPDARREARDATWDVVIAARVSCNARLCTLATEAA